MAVNTSDRRKALIAMSGGVDSSIAAYLAKQAGYDCLGATMILFRQNNGAGGRSQDAGGCVQSAGKARDIRDAAGVAKKLGIDFEVLDFSEEFREKIIEDFVLTYERGETPNPCVRCNRVMKFDKLLRFAGSRGCDTIVTGHYARVCFNEATGRFELKKAADESKDQTYFLYSLSQEQLSRCCFPLGGLHKTQVRVLAEELSFSNAQKHDSQDVCFIENGKYAEFMEDYRGAPYPAGDFLDTEGKVVGRHRGAVRYTLGQRKGLGLAMGKPVYVLRKDMEANTVTVGPESLLFSDTLLARDVNWVSVDGLTEPMKVTAKTRYSQKAQPATAFPAENGLLRVKFDKPQRAITPGQAVVLYDGDTVVGGGTIV